MGGGQVTIPGTSVRRRRGAAESALEDTFKAWNAAGHYVGDEYRALRHGLRLQAQALDELHAAGPDKAAAKARHARDYAEQLRALDPTRPAIADDLDLELESIAAELRHDR